MNTYLDKILVAHRAAVAADTRSVESMIDQAKEMGPTRPFAAALRRPDEVAVIAEIKRRSPSKGDLNPGISPPDWARSYEEGGAAALSVLTDEDFFGGSAADLQSARNAVSVPVLRKDFTVSAKDVCDARLMGADAVLLIAAALDNHELADFHTLARELGLGVLVETHDEAEVDRAMEIGADVVGVNQRDLVTFHVDQARAVRVASHIPDSVVKVAESGITGPESIRPLCDAGYDAVLVGEALVTGGDARSGVEALRTSSRSC